MGDTQSNDMRRAFLAMAERRAAPGGGTHPDITRMLGAAADDAMEDVRAAVNRHRPADRADIESMAGMGRLEYGPPR
jgi:hypothetical protein